MFQIKDFISITASMINWMKVSQSKVTDFNVGSVARTLVEAPAVEIEELYQQFFIGLREAMPVATFRSFGFDKLPTTVATGVVSISQNEARTSDLLIPSGTLFKATDGREYASLQDVTWLTGTTFVRVPIISSLPGVMGNADAGVIYESSFFNDEVKISNQAITTGRDSETESEREIRFAEYIASLSRGTNEAIRYIAGQNKIVSTEGWIEEYVTRIGMQEIPGRTTVYLYTSLGMPSGELIERCQKAIDGYHNVDTGQIVPGYRPSGVRVDVVPMAERTIALTLSVGMLSGYGLTQAVIQSLQNVFDGAITSVLPGDTLYLNELAELMLTVGGIKQVIIDSSENIICQQNEALLPGTLSVNPMA